VTNSSSRKALLPVTSAVLLILALAASSCHQPRNAEAQQKIAVDIPTVAVAKAGTSDLSHVLVLTAEFTPFQEVDLMAKVAGYVKNINVDLGDRVKQGQLIAVLEIPEMTNEVTKAKAGVQRSQAQVTQAQDEVKRAESAHQMAHLNYERLAAVMKTRPGLIAQQEVDDAQSKDLVAEAQVQVAKSNLAAAVEQVGVTKADLGKYETMFDYTRVTAPFSGVITKRFANTGSMIQAGTASQTQAMPIVRLSENSLLRLTLPVPESAVPTVHVGQQVDVRVPTLNRTFPGKVARFADKVQSATRTMDTEVDVPNSSLVLVPGMYAEVDLTLQRSNDALAIPVSAVDLDSSGSSDDGRKNTTGKVLVVKPDNHLELRNVTIGLETANRVEIRSGLRDGELVVIGNRAALQPGQVVKPKITVMMAKGEN
jgi:RND family efflux transporter MFP subunit